MANNKKTEAPATRHRVFFQSSQDMSRLADQSVNLIVTSPPYPMIAMWDDLFCGLNPAIVEALEANEGMAAFELMHRELDAVWREAFRVLANGGFACINIGDAVRTVGGKFRLYTSHARILSFCQEIGFSALPAVIWRKQTNAPNKFMGSGMLPGGAYVTLEHEYVLILRKGGKREFKTAAARRHRQESAYFWEERNDWFSDVWFDLKGASQRRIDPQIRERSGAFPFELAYRLINMYSVRGDLVLDPFLGTGTTTLAALASERNSAGYEADEGFEKTIRDTMLNGGAAANDRIEMRLTDHRRFASEREQKGKPAKKTNEVFGFPCVSGQETRLTLNRVATIEETAPMEFVAGYS